MALTLRNGWFTDNGRIIWGYAQHNGWWGGYRGGPSFKDYKVRTAITRRADGQVGPSLTEDLDALTDAMKAHGYPGFEHNFGLWYDRRRDAHDQYQRSTPAVGPFMQMPWARAGGGTAWDGEPTYDLTQFDDWYFARLREFARLCDAKGLVFFHNFYMQHALLETNAHYVDFPWRPVNCEQDTDMPDANPAANAFYDVTHPVRRKLHESYIRKCLEELGEFSNVVYLPSEEFTGPASFVRFWMDTVADWEAESGTRVTIGVGATKDVLDEVLEDPAYGNRVDVADLRYWWYEADGSLNAPEGGKEIPARYTNQVSGVTPEQLYRQIREFRDRYPQKAIVHCLGADAEQTHAFLMAGGSMLIHGMQYADAEPPSEPWEPPRTYVAPEHSSVIQELYDRIRTEWAELLLEMRPVDVEEGWCLEAGDGRRLVYRGGELRLEGSTG